MRISHQTRLVLSVMLDAPSEEVYGFELAQASGLPSGTIYPILRRLEDQGLVSSRWEVLEETDAGRRRRRYYRMTGEGARIARNAVQSEAVALRLLVPGWSS